ncbi:MAG: FixH family protein, partial [Cyclobacteriaceae bacterium]|nr:FixH family protein [Cyclobacteriaceae bacterium]
MKNILLKGVMLSVILWTVSSCNEETVVAPINYNEIVTGLIDANNISVTVFSEYEVNTGHFPFFVELKDATTQQVLSGYTVKVVPMMHMTTKSHSTFIQPWESNLLPKDTHGFEAVFVMPSGDMGYWELKVLITDNNGVVLPEIILPITVLQPVQSTLNSFLSATDEAKIFVALTQPKKPEIGINDLDFILFKMETMMSFPAIETYHITFVPEMPTMDHGSPNNVDPVFVANGHYLGKVNFTMTGLWRLNLTLSDETQTLVGTTSFDIEF